jgi:monoterpene epsilon-lactone hydrolase
MSRKFLIILLFKVLKRLNAPLSYLKLARKIIHKISFFYPLPSWASFTKVYMANTPCVWVRDLENSYKKTIIYIHGGAFVLGLNAAYFHFAATLARSLEASILLIDYRLAPEYPFPKALEDCISTYKELLKTSMNPHDILFMGDSAGGGLALSTLLALKETSIVLPKAAIILSGWLDLSLKGKHSKINRDTDPIVLVHHMLKIKEAYMGREKDACQPLISPLYGNLEGLPPLFLQVGKHEVLREDTQRFIKKAQKQGLRITGRTELDALHVHPILFPNDLKSVEIIKEIKEFIKDLG